MNLYNWLTLLKYLLSKILYEKYFPIKFLSSITKSIERGKWKTFGIISCKLVWRIFLSIREDTRIRYSNVGYISRYCSADEFNEYNRGHWSRSIFRVFLWKIFLLLFVGRIYGRNAVCRLVFARKCSISILEFLLLPYLHVSKDEEIYDRGRERCIHIRMELVIKSKDRCNVYKDLRHRRGGHFSGEKQTLRGIDASFPRKNRGKYSLARKEVAWNVHRRDKQRRCTFRNVRKRWDEARTIDEEVSYPEERGRARVKDSIGLNPVFQPALLSAECRSGLSRFINLVEAWNRWARIECRAFRLTPSTAKGFQPILNEPVVDANNFRNANYRSRLISAAVNPRRYATDIRWTRWWKYEGEMEKRGKRRVDVICIDKFQGIY